MKNPTFKQLGGLSGSVADRLRDVQDELDGEKIQLALSDPNHPFLEGVKELALRLFPTTNWNERDGVIYITFTSTGMSGAEWKAHFQKRKFPLSSNAERLLDDRSFVVSKAGTVRTVAILKGEMFTDAERITRKIRVKAAEFKFAPLDMELVCLIRDNFTNKQINDWGLNWIVGMHDPVEIGGDPSLLTVFAYGSTPKLLTYYDYPGDYWDRVDGFAFGASQVNSQDLVS